MTSPDSRTPAAKHLGTISCIGFSTAQRESALTLVDERDQFGMRKAVVTQANWNQLA